MELIELVELQQKNTDGLLEFAKKTNYNLSLVSGTIDSIEILLKSFNERIEKLEGKCTI